MRSRADLDVEHDSGKQALQGYNKSSGAALRTTLPACPQSGCTPLVLVDACGGVVVVEALCVKSVNLRKR